MENKLIYQLVDHHSSDFTILIVNNKNIYANIKIKIFIRSHKHENRSGDLHFN